MRLYEIIEKIRMTSERRVGNSPFTSTPMLNAQVIEALTEIDRRLRALELCRHDGGPHRWVCVKADGTELRRGEPLSLAVGTRCAGCDIHGDPYTP